MLISSAENRLFERALLQKRPIIVRSLLIVATAYTCSNHTHTHAFLNRLYLSLFLASPLSLTHITSTNSHARMLFFPSQIFKAAAGPSNEISVEDFLQVHCNTLQHTATHCNTLQHTATHCSTLQHTAARCSTLQHTATSLRSVSFCVAMCVAVCVAVRVAVFCAAFCRRLAHILKCQRTAVLQCVLQCVLHWMLQCRAQLFVDDWHTFSKVTLIRNL